ncbi:hypothetical protein [Arcanobacterium bovis]|nr:hypothetical protein [Arcanobacterium bovis]
MRSDFATDANTGSIGLNPSSEYWGYGHILVRERGGEWRVLDGGYP